MRSRSSVWSHLGIYLAQELTMGTDKKLLVTCLQHTNNWTMGNDRFKMSFWFEMLFDDEMKNEPIHEMPPDDLNVEKVHQEVQNWLSRHRKKDPLATQLLQKYQD